MPKATFGMKKIIFSLYNKMQKYIKDKSKIQDYLYQANYKKPTVTKEIKIKEIEMPQKFLTDEDITKYQNSQNYWNTKVQDYLLQANSLYNDTEDVSQPQTELQERRIHTSMKKEPLHEQKEELGKEELPEYLKDYIKTKNINPIRKIVPREDFDLEALPHENDEIIQNKEIEANFTRQIHHINEIYQNLKNELRDFENELIFLRQEQEAGRITAIQYATRVHNINHDMNLIRADMNDAELELSRLHNEKLHILNQNQEFEKENAEVKQRNAEKLNTYKNVLSDVNHIDFQTAQEPWESDRVYLNRLKQKGDIVSEQTIQNNIEIQVINELKHKLKELTRDDVLIDEILKLIPSLDSRIEFIKNFPFIKENFLKHFGYNNKYINVEDVKNFLIHLLTTNNQVETLIHQSAKKTPNQKEKTPNQKEKTPEKILNKLSAISKSLDNHKVLEIDLENNGKVMFKPDINELYYYNEKGRFVKVYAQSAIYKILKDTFILKEIVPKDTRIGMGGLIKIIRDQLKEHSANKDSTKKRLFIEEEEEEEEPEEQENIGGELQEGLGEATFGLGLALNIPNRVKFGSIEILFNKLYYDNILSIRNKNNEIIRNFPSIKVSDNFVSVINDIIHKKTPNIHKLSLGERTLYDTLIRLSNLHKDVPNSLKETTESLKKRYEILHDEINAGNNSNQIKQEMKDILHKLHHFKKLTKKQVNEYLSNLGI